VLWYPDGHTEERPIEYLRGEFYELGLLEEVIGLVEICIFCNFIMKVLQKRKRDPDTWR
jgi:hypothetical protein